MRHPSFAFANGWTILNSSRFLNEDGVVSVTGSYAILAPPARTRPPYAFLLDFLPRPTSKSTDPLLFWLIRRVEVIRGTMPLRMECAPAFNYARDPHETSIVPDSSVLASQDKIVFTSESLTLDLRYIAEVTLEPEEDALRHCAPTAVPLRLLDLSARGHLGFAACAELQLVEGQAVTFILRTPPENSKETKAEEAMGGTTRERAAELGVPFESEPMRSH